MLRCKHAVKCPGFLHIYEFGNAHKLKVAYIIGPAKRGHGSACRKAIEYKQAKYSYNNCNQFSIIKQAIAYLVSYKIRAQEFIFRALLQAFCMGPALMLICTLIQA